MRIAILFLLVVGPQVCAAPAPLPRPPKPKPAPVRQHWEIDFAPTSKAGMVNLGIELMIRTADGRANQFSVGQSGQVLVSAIIDAFAGSFQKDDLEIDAAKTRMTIKTLRGMPVTSVEMTLRNLEQRFAPVVLPPGRVAPPGKR